MVENLSHKRILIIKNRALGDAIIGLSTVSYLKQILPSSTLIYGVPSWVAPLFSQRRGAADEIYPFQLKSLSDSWNLLRDLKRLKIDYILELHQGGRTGKLFKLFEFLTRTPYFFHNHHQKSGGEVLDQGVRKAIIQRDLDGAFSFLVKYGYTGSPPHFQDFPPEMSLSEDKPDKKILFGIVATRDPKRWPISHYHQLAKLLEQELPDYKVLIPLGPEEKDKSLRDEFLNRGDLPNVEFLQLPLDKLPEAIKGSKLYIGNDTGLKHLAVALGMKTFTFFGPEEPLEWHPYREEDHPFFFVENLECRTRVAHYCALKECDSMICLNQILPEKVLEKVKTEIGL